MFVCVCARDRDSNQIIGLILTNLTHIFGRKISVKFVYGQNHINHFKIDTV